MYHRAAVEPIVDFVRGIGIEVVFGDGGNGGFLPGINIHAGAIHIDMGTLVGSGDILHEAGHIVMVPRSYWPRLGRDLQADLDALVEESAQTPEGPDPLLVRGARQGELMSQAWSYAVVEALNLSQECVFFPGSYKNHDYTGKHPMLLWLESGTHFGPLFLADAGMSGYSGMLAAGRNNGLPPFPHMTRWSVD